MEETDGGGAGAASGSWELRGRPTDAADQPLLGLVPSARRGPALQHGLSLLQARHGAASGKQACRSTHANSQFTTAGTASSAASTLRKSILELFPIICHSQIHDIFLVGSIISCMLS